MQLVSLQVMICTHQQDTLSKLCPPNEWLQAIQGKLLWTHCKKNKSLDLMMPWIGDTNNIVNK